MASVVPLKFTAKLICIQTLLDLSGDGDKEAAQRMLRQLQTGCFTAVSCGLLRRLVERYPGKVTNNVLSALASTHLRELKLKKCKSVSFAGLKNVLENCPLVTKLDLSECDQFSQPEVFHIASFLRPGITALSLENCLTVDNSVVQSILLYMKTLQHLNLSGCSKLTDNVFLLNENLQLQRETFGQMTQECYDCALISVDVSCTTLTSTAVRHLATLTGPTLKHVNISWTGADTLALLYLSGYGRPAILDLTLSDPDTVLDFPLELSLLELKNTLNKLKLGMLRKERAKNGNYGDIPVNGAADTESFSSIDPNQEVTASSSSIDSNQEVTASLPYCDPNPDVTASLSYNDPNLDVTASLSFSDPNSEVKASLSPSDSNPGNEFGAVFSYSYPNPDIGVSLLSSQEHSHAPTFTVSANSHQDVENAVLPQNTQSEISTNLMSQQQNIQNTLDIDQVDFYPSTEDHVDIGKSPPLFNFCEDKSTYSGNKIKLKSFMEIMEEASDSDCSVDCTTEEGEDSDSEGSVNSDKLLSKFGQQPVVNGLILNVTEPAVYKSSKGTSTSCATEPLIGAALVEGHTCDETIHFIGGSDVDDLTSDVTVHVNDDSYSWTVDKCSEHNLTSDIDSCCEICSRLKSDIAKSFTDKTEHSDMSQASDLSQNTTSLITQDPQSDALSQKSGIIENLHSSLASDRLNNAQSSLGFQYGQDVEKMPNSESCQTFLNSKFKELQENSKTSEICLSADFGVPKDMTEVNLSSNGSGTTSACSSLSNHKEEQVQVYFTEDDTGMKYYDDSVKSGTVSNTIPTSGDKNCLTPSKVTISPDNNATSYDENVVSVTLDYGDGMRFDENFIQKNNSCKYDNVIISDETGIPIVIPCDKQSVCSESGTICSESGTICSESGMICSESGTICSESGMICSKSGTICSESGTICSESGMICFESGIMCSESGMMCSESETICSESGMMCSESGTICSESGMMCSESGTICSESGTICSKSGTICSESGTICSESGTICSESGTICSDSGIKTSESGTVCSESGTVCSESGTVCSESGVKRSESGNTILESGTVCSESGTVSSESRTVCSESGMVFSESGTFNSESRTVCSESGTVSSESGTVSSESGMVYSESGTFSSESGTVSSESGMVYSESGTFSSESGTVSSESGMVFSESGTFNSESRTVCSESGTVSSESGTFCSEFGMVFSESGTFNSESRTVCSESGTVSSESGTVSSESGMVYSESGTFSSESGTVSSESGMVFSESGTFNSESRTVCSESGTVSSESGTVSSESGMVYSESGTFSSESGTVSSESGMVFSESGTFNSESRTVCSESGTVSSESGTVSSESGMVYSESGTFCSESGMVYSESGTVSSESGMVFSESGTFNSESRTVCSESGTVSSESGTVSSESGMVYSESGTFCSESGMVFSESGTVSSESGTVCSESGTFNSESGMVYSESGTVSSESGMVYSESGTFCSESGMVYSESGTVCSESGMVYSESGTVSSESGTVCSESGMVYSESGTFSSESGMVYSESGTFSSESGTVSSESGTVSSESGTVSSESGTVSSESGTVSSESGMVYSESGTVSSESGTVCSESGVTCSESSASFSIPVGASSESVVTCSGSGAFTDVHFSNCDNSLNSGTVERGTNANVQKSCQEHEISDTSLNEPGAFFDLQNHKEHFEKDIMLEVDNSESTAMDINESGLNDDCIKGAYALDKSDVECKSLDDPDELKHFIDSELKGFGDHSEINQLQNTRGSLDESGEYCYSDNSAESNPINSNQNSENGEIEDNTEPSGTEYVQFYKPDLISIDFKRIEFENTYKYSGLKCLKIFSTENKNLQKVKISWKDNLKSSMLEELAPLWPNVNYISLIDCESLTSQSLVTLATKCKQIQTLTLQGVTFIQDFAMIPFINNGCLESLNLAECRITDHTLTRMSKHKMEKMRELDLSWCDDTSSVGLDRLFGKTSDTLRKLSIRQLAANDKTLSLIASNFHLLTSLNMSSVDGITDDAVVNLVESIRTLEHVDFSWNLGVSNRSISALLKNCQRLQRADLAGLKTITSEPFLPLISNLRQWRRCQALLRLKLHERSVAAASADAGTSSDEEYTDIYMPHRSTVYGTDLTYLNLEFCDQVNDNHLAEICIVCRRESLTIFNYYGELVKPELFIGQGRQWYSNYIPAHDD